MHFNFDMGFEKGVCPAQSRDALVAVPVYMYKDMYRGMYKYKQNYRYTSTYSAWLAWAVFLQLPCNSSNRPIHPYHKEL